ncbi:S41 family peptidase [Salegentibacter salegens]|uniref:Peptidase family S41 n=1 Tax=Salegentibacter salegens TaxID=143223 RepID=A0A1M7JBJ7_9FLAO|nr:S41 family peptidase [Salegentibacter salegens]PRX38734.1 peptidase S41-like protein [Salegentibacter salegens]SHM49867.1 Peptidase family S41 [Salegentibacter salegens]
MKKIILLSILFSFIITISKAQDKTLSKEQVQQDLEFLKKHLNEKSSYVYLNGYDFNTDFKHYINSIGDSTSLEDFGLFLNETIGKIGDRHSSLTAIKGFRLNENLFLPFIYAPLNGKIVVLDLNQNEEYELLNTRFPFLKEIDGMSINSFLQKIRPEHIEAPQQTYFTRAVRDIRDIQKNYRILGKTLPENIKLTLTDSAHENDTTLVVNPVDRSNRLRPWDEEFGREYVLVDDEDYNKKEIIEKLFYKEKDIAHIKIPAMVSKNEAPLLFEKLNSFMKSINKNSKALIIDVRSNNGGTRDLVYECAKYLVHPDSIHVVNATRQRGPNPLPQEYIDRLHGRYLYSMGELNSEEKAGVNNFLESFDPIYNLDDKKYSEYYFGILNGKKLHEDSFYYDKPVYILANEKTFSAASVFVSIFKDIPNIKIVGVTTDGSSGNSEWFDLPNSKLAGKISTMVSFQKNGKILDGFGTEPDIKIERDISQVLWDRDSQLEIVRDFILTTD